MKRFIFLVHFVLCTLSTFAIDPSGARVDYDNDPINGNLLILAIIAFIVWVAYQYFSSEKERNGNRPSKPQREPVKMYSKEWFDIERQKAERIDKEAKGAMTGFAIFILIIVIPILVQKCS